ncbi:MAG: RagB/SusD domain protein [Bacteroidetes bacterium]|nr:RagB/SusD domain protein [Bacteroidota bacterium]
MKRIQIKIFIGTAVLSLFLMGCSNILDEQPRSSYTSDYFKTSSGVMSEITALYAHLRNIYGNGYFYNNCQTGTDESTWGASGTSGSTFQAHDFSVTGSKPTATNNDAGSVWFNTFPYINTANGVIENASAVGISNAVIAEAKFFRAFDYFLLVQTFGGVPLDLGAGELTYNTSTVRTSKRNTVPEVYTKAIFPDLLSAINDLPDAGRLTGGVTKTAARLYLAKAYLTYGWWLENPNNIPTYPDCARTDPNGKTAAWYYQAAYDMATTAIKSPASFGLQATYYDVNVGTNDRNNEILLYADHTQASELFNAASLTYESGGTGPNFASWFQTWNYTSITSSKTNWSSPSKLSSVQREAVQGLGRPWVRMAPPIGVFTNTFADKTYDSRYDGTFTTVYRGNWIKASASNPTTLYNANNMLITQGDAVLTFLDSDPTTTIDYSNSPYASSVGAGVLPGRADYVIAPSAISRLVYPGIWKLGPYRTDNGTGLGQPNAGSTRPFPIAKFSELFFIAAEAAVKGATTTAVTGTYANDGTARGLINVIRARAGKWSWSNNGNKTKVEDNSAAMVTATPATIDINYILAERSREYYGEGYRWYDLVRTQKWSEIGGSFKICGTSASDHTVQTITRDIPVNYYLRPIPQGQFDAMEATTEEKVAYQNPAYR